MVIHALHTRPHELSGLSDTSPLARKLEDVRVFATYTNEYVSVSQASGAVPIKDQYRSGTTSALRLSLQVDKRDNRLFPTAGFYGSLSADLAPPFLAPQGLFGHSLNLFTPYVLDTRYYQPLWLGLPGIPPPRRRRSRMKRRCGA